VSYPCEERKGGAPLLALIPCIVTIPVTASVLCSHPSQKRRRMGHPYRCRTSSRRPGPPSPNPEWSAPFFRSLHTMLLVASVED
jgi:hypothetical protein